MKKQILVAIGREYGSDGHNIAKKLAEELGIGYYDRKILDDIAERKNIKIEYLEKYDEEPIKIFGSRSVDARACSYSNSIEEIIANIQFDYIREKADEGESFVIVGRCAEEILRSREGLISIFILGDFNDKVKRMSEKFKISEREAVAKIKRHDKSRKKYHNFHAEGKWGDSRTYDLCINSSKLGFEKTVEILKNYVLERTK